MRKKLTGFVSVLGVFGGVLSSEAMLVEENAADIQSQRQLVQVQKVMLPIQCNEWEKVSSDWSALHTAFFRALSKNEREGFDELLLSSPSNSLCRFVGEHILLEFLNSPYRPKLEKNSFREFFVETRNLLDPQKFYCGACINEGKLISLVLGEMGRWVPRELRDSIWSNYMKACMDTRVKEEEWKQERFSTLIEEERLKKEMLSTQIESEKLKQSKMKSDRKRIETKSAIDAATQQLELLKQVQKLEESELDLSRKKLKLRSEVRESEWREEHQVADRVLGVVEKVAPPIADKIGEKIGEKMASTTK